MLLHLLSSPLFAWQPRDILQLPKQRHSQCVLGQKHIYMTIRHRLLRKNSPVSWRCLACHRFAEFKPSFVHHLFWIHLRAAGTTLVSEPEYGARRRNDIFRANMETWRPETAAAATDAHGVSGSGHPWAGVAVLRAGLPQGGSSPLPQML